MKKEYRLKVLDTMEYNRSRTNLCEGSLFNSIPGYSSLGVTHESSGPPVLQIKSGARRAEGDVKSWGEYIKVIS